MYVDKPKSAINKLSFNKFFNKTFAFNTSRHCKGAANDKYKHQYTKMVYKGDGRRILKHSYVICFANKLKHYYRHIGLRRFDWLQLALFLYARKKKDFHVCEFMRRKGSKTCLQWLHMFTLLLREQLLGTHSLMHKYIPTCWRVCIFVCELMIAHRRT